MNVIEVIQEKYASLTKKQRILADYMLQNPDAMCFVTLKDLCAATKVSEMTILHVCTALGYKSYNELKYEFRKYAAIQSKIEVQKQNLYAIADVPHYELTDKANVMAEICKEEFEQAALLYANVKIEDLFHAVEMLLDANNIILCGRGVSMQAAEFLSMRLATLGLPSVVANTEQIDSIQAALPFFNRGVLVVPISLPDYYFMTTKVCEFAKERHASILCLTDSLKSPIVPYGDHVLLAPCATRLYLNTVAPMMALINLLTSALNIEKSARKSNKFSSPEEFSRFFLRNAPNKL